MKANIDAKALCWAMGVASKVPCRSPISILEQLRVDVAGGICRLTGTNLNQYISVETPANGGDFSFVFKDTKHVLKVLKLLNGNLALDYPGPGHAVTLSCGSHRFQAQTEEPEDFPAAPAVEAPKSYPIDPGSLSQRFDLVKYAVAGEKNPRTAYTGIRFDLDRLIAVDGYRMAMHTDPSLRVERPFILPYAAMAYLRLIGREDSRIDLDQYRAAIRGGGVTLITSILEDSGPSPGAAIPTVFQEQYTVGVEPFMRELKYLDTVLPQNARVPVRFEAGGLSASFGGTEVRARVEIDGTAHIDYGFDRRHMLDALTQFKGAEQIQVQVLGPSAPIVLTDGADNLALVMPSRLWEAAA